MRTLLCIFAAVFGFLTFVTAGLASSTICTRPNTTELTYRSDGYGLNEIYEALVTCPNITSLDLDFVWTGCVAPSDPSQFNFHPGDRFPPLQKLSLSDYDLDSRWRQQPWFYGYRSQHEPFSLLWDSVKEFFTNIAGQQVMESPPPVAEESNLKKWLQVMDFSQLEELHLAQEQKTFYERMRHELPGLRRLSFEWANSGPSVPEERISFIRSMPPLESLSIAIGSPHYYDEAVKNRTQFPLSAILERHGSSLQSISLRQGECHEANLRRPMLSVDDISAIRATCTNLKHLGLDIDRDEPTGWPNTTFEAITQMSGIESLTLRLEIGADLHEASEHGRHYWNPEGLNGAGPFREPRMSLEVAQSLFEDLRTKKVGEELKRVEFVVGDFEEKPYSGPVYFPSWEEGRVRSFSCDIADADANESPCRVSEVNNWNEEDY